MKFDVGRAVFVGFVIFILLLSITVTVAEETEFQVESTNLQIYRDGLVRVTQTLVVNETFPVVTLPLFASSVDNIIVVDENQTVMDYEIEGINLNVFTFGATNVSLQYDTDSLTRKDFDIWSLIVDTPYNLTVLLPEDSTVIDLSEMPASIDTEGNKISMSLFPSQWEISYVFPLVSPAEFQVSDLEVTPLDVKGGEEVTVSVKVTNVGGQTGSYTLSLFINQTTEDTRTVTLDKGESTTTEFKVTKQTPGTYNIEIAGLVSGFTVKEANSNGTPTNGTPSNGTPSNGKTSKPIPVEYLAAVVVAVVAVLFAVYILVIRRRGPNVEKLFKVNPHLMKEEKDVIRFLAEKEGKAFEAEIRERFPEIPRTSLWRLVRRLEKLEIVKVKKIGLENRVELKK
ncbi:MAG: hypothetical protein JSW14_07385 [Candidatus Bathyarchaeum sp.]|nr:MAG: hypothetical protein JSW14_07385 [Candidatus Bathyarchaeum sp.]